MRKLALCAMSLLIFSSGIIIAQEKNVPLDPEVRYGKLENGMTYYIKHNEKTKERAEFYLANDVGAILETDAQNGLAHFCEHMCFNGTNAMPGKAILNYFETIGMEFGRNLNAGTGRDQTIYMLMQTPVTREGIIDTALLTLHEWASNVAFDNQEIDDERGVIVEEWRTRRTADFRMSKALDPVKYKGSKYAERDIIGDLEVLKNFEYETIKSFYKDWYRPDLQAIIVVGDIDIDQIEKKIIDQFSKIAKSEKAKDRVTFDVPDNKEPLVGIATDKEAQNSMISIYYKHDYTKPEDKDLDYYKNSIARNLYASMINERYNELLQKGNPPFIYGYAYYGSYAGNKEAYTLSAGANDNILAGITSLLTESERVRRHGFTQSELERAKTDMLRSAEKSLKEKDQQQNRRLAFNYVGHFLGNSPTPGYEFAYNYLKENLPSITVDQVNSLAQKWIRDENIVITVEAPEKEGIVIPTEEEILATLNKIKQANIEAYVDQVSDKPLMAKMPEVGKIEKTTQNEEFAFEELVLSNGVKVILKPTDFKEDEILINAFSKGGSSLYPVENLISVDFASTLVNRSGVGEFNLIELQKMLTGKVVNVNPYIGELYEGFNGNASPADFETALQLINLYFTNPRFDEAALNAFLSRYKAFIQNKALNPNAVFQDSVTFIVDDRNPRSKPLGAEDLDNINFEIAKKVYSERFADAGDFTFIFTGNLDTEKVKPMIEKYLGSLPSIKRNENWVDNNVRSPKGKSNHVIKKQLEVPKNSVFVNYNGTFKYNLENRLKLQALKHILDIRYTATIREEEGGTYGVGIWNTASKYPAELFSLNMTFDCDPEKSDKLKSIIYAEIEKIIAEGPKQEDLDKAKENFLKNRENSLKENRFWSNSLAHNYKYNEDVLDTEEYNATVNSLTVKDIQNTAKELLTQGNVIEIVMTPAE